MHFIFSLNLSSVAHEISSLEDPNGANSRKGLLEKINNKLDKFPNFSGGGLQTQSGTFCIFFGRVPLSIILRRCQVVVACVAGWLGLCMYTFTKLAIKSSSQNILYSVLSVSFVHCAVCTTSNRLYRYRLYTLLHLHCMQIVDSTCFRFLDSDLWKVGWK